MHAINGNKWVKIVAMQQDSATLIYDLTPWKEQWRVILKKNRTGIQNRIFTSKPEKSCLVL